jgi:hypothetical protein
MESIIAEYTRVARNYYKDALTLNKSNLFGEVWNFTNRFLLALVPEGLTWIEALRFMLMHPIEKTQLSSEWGKTNQFQDMIKTQVLFHWAFLLCQLIAKISPRAWSLRSLCVVRASSTRTTCSGTPPTALPFVQVRKPMALTLSTADPLMRPSTPRHVLARDGSRYESETQWWFQGMAAAGKEPWLSTYGERNKLFASMSWSEVETYIIMDKQGAAAEAKIAACAVAARANNAAIQGPASSALAAHGMDVGYCSNCPRSRHAPPA